MGHFKFEVKLGGTEYKIDFELREKLTVISGNSGTGKTLVRKLCEKSRSYEVQRNVLCYGYESMYKLEIALEHSLDGISNKLIILDNADILLSNIKGLVEHINKDESNYYILMYRGLNHDLEMTPASLAELKYDESLNRFYIKYEYEAGVWG